MGKTTISIYSAQCIYQLLHGMTSLFIMQGSLKITWLQKKKSQIVLTILMKPCYKNLIAGSQVPEDLTFQDFLDIDENIVCMEEILDDEIIKQVLNPDTEEQFDDDEECKAIPRPTLKEAIEWLSGLDRFFEVDDNFDMPACIDSMKVYVYQSVALKQTKISNFFGTSTK